MSTVRETGGPRARLTDPETSHLAAEGSDLEGSQLVVVTLLEYAGPTGLTDEELFEGANTGWVIALTGNRYSPSRLRTARSELVDLGRVVDAGMYRFTVYGRTAKVWMLERFEEDAA